MRKLFRLFSLLAVVTVVACVTINIYFPAEEVRSAADKIVNEVWGERSEQPATPPAAPPAETKPPGSSYQLRIGPALAHAQDINVSTPEIRAIKESMKQRSASLFPCLTRAMSASAPTDCSRCAPPTASTCAPAARPTAW